MSLQSGSGLARLALLALLSTAAGETAAAVGSSPAPPDYAQAASWAAWPGRPSSADSLAPGLPDAAVSSQDQVDVFFIHPTTYLSGGADNARYDEPGLTSSQLDRGVLRFQASVFNACCRIYAPRYRQANIRAFFPSGGPKAIHAYELAYGDVLRALDYYLEHENHGRPFIIASHSQGSLHAMRLLQERVAGKALQRQLVVAYVIGHAVPLEFDRSGIPVCRSPTQTGCLVDWNSVKEGTSDAARRESRYIWLDGRYQPLGVRGLVCVNPLNWSAGGAAPADLNLGSLPGVHPGEALLAPVLHLTGARCEADGLLHVDIAASQRRGFSDALTAFGSYHVFDYNLFYVNTRTNARDRIVAFRAARH